MLLNEATPVIGDIAMETITETLITESTMIGHNPTSPGGLGLGVGHTMHIRDLVSAKRTDKVIVVIPRDYDFEVAAKIVGRALEAGVDVQGGIVQSDDGVLIANRLPKTMPFVDEVAHIDRVPLNMPAAVEVARARAGRSPACQSIRHRQPVRADAAGDGAGDPHRQGADRAALGGGDPHAVGGGEDPAHPGGLAHSQGRAADARPAKLDGGADEIMDLIAQVAPSARCAG